MLNLQDVLLWALFVEGLLNFWQLLRIRRGLDKTFAGLDKSGQTK